ncbi:MAG: hypothetical protein GY742_10930 [Hyphomicrobiales bacterium]|nr:hypothetical protein [Hyphomicrobiales bacterium]
MDITTGTFFDGLPVSLKLITLTVILVLVLLFVFGVIRILFRNTAKNRRSAPLPRLAVVDAANVDNSRRLVLIRRDDVEHLVMIGGTTDVLVESNIEHTIPARLQDTQQSHPPVNSQVTRTEEFSDTTVLTDTNIVDETSPLGKTDTLAKSSDEAIPSPATSSWRDRVNKTTIVGAVASQSSEAGLSDDNNLEENQTDSSETVDQESDDPSQQIDKEVLTNTTDAHDEELADASNPETATTPPISTISENLSDSETKEAEPVDNPEKNETELEEPPKKKDMEVEMQRLLNELTGEKT